MRFPGTGNPVYELARRELSRRRKPRRWWRILAALGYLLALGLALVAYLGEWVGLLFWRDAQPVRAAVAELMSFVGLLVLFMHITVLFRTLLAAASMVSSARSSGKWELLILTGIPSRRIIHGMWWALLRVTLPDWLRLLPLRAGVVAYLGAATSYPVVRYFAFQPALRDPALEVVPPSPLALLLLVPLTLALSMLAAGITAATGLFASALARRLGGALAFSLGISALLLGGALAFNWLAQNALLTAYPPGDIAGTERYVLLSNITAGATVSWFDNGVSLTSLLVRYDLLPGPVDTPTVWRIFRDASRSQGLEAGFWGGLSVAAVSFVLVTRLMLRAAQWAASRAGALRSTSR